MEAAAATQAAVARPVRAVEFAEAMAPLAPRAPLAIAVSGGADSMALTLLAAAWAQERGAQLVALTVDHGLRPESALEAARVGDWLSERGIAQETLHWTGSSPGTRLQAAAREARYKLLTAWCRSHRVRDLLVGHHAGDQAETFLLRLARGSGGDGLAAMAPAIARGEVRILRPLLRIPKERLTATLERFGQDWISDPSNADRRFARVRARTALRDLPPVDAAIGVRARARAGLAALADDLMARTAVFDAAGFCRLDPAKFAAEPAETGARALGRVLRSVGGRGSPPARAAVARLLRTLVGGGTGSLHGCRLLQIDSEAWVVREARGLPSVPVRLGKARVWDGRFDVRLDSGPDGARVGPLGAEGWRQIRGRKSTSTPYPARISLPALWVGGQMVAAPHLGWESAGVRFEAAFRGPLRDPSFAVVSAPGYPM